MTDYEDGPFLTIKSFNNWVFAAATRQRPGPDGIIPGLDHPCMYRKGLPDNGTIYFTHGDLTPGNVIISGDPGHRTIQAIIDWEQAGWYPEYWEHWKTFYGAGYLDEWYDEDWPSKIAGPLEEDVFSAIAQYSLDDNLDI